MFKPPSGREHLRSANLGSKMMLDAPSESATSLRLQYVTEGQPACVLILHTMDQAEDAAGSHADLAADGTGLVASIPVNRGLQACI